MKICISGAGIAGPALAHWLLRQGHQITLVEKAPQLRRGGYIVDFWGKGYDIAERMGILPRILDAGYHVREVRLVDAHGRRNGGFDARVFARSLQGRFVSLPRGELASILFDTVKDGVEMLFGNHITSLRDAGSAVEVEFSQAAPRVFDLVIGADGLHSNVRTLAFPPASYSEQYLGFHVAAFEAQGYRPRDELVYMSYARPGCQIARFAMRGDRTIFMLVVAAEQPIEAHTREAQNEVLRAAFDSPEWECRSILAQLENCDSLYFDRVSQMHVAHWTQGRVALIGDAAHCPSLLAGEGCALAILDAYVLAGELARAGNDHSRAFQTFEQRLHRFTEDKQRSARQFAKQFVPRTALGVWVRRWATRAMSLPGVTNLLLTRALRDEIDLPDY